MAHLIDQTTGKSAIAYIGDTPWHGLGQALSADAPLEVWAQEAGLSHQVLETPACFDAGSDNMLTVPNRKVLYRDDTLAALGIVSNDYKVVQPAEVLGFFDELVKLGGFTLETAGALMDGKRIWALAKVHDGAPIVSNDVVRPYLLLTTSYDASLATTAKLTAVRVVCNNTLSISINSEHSSHEQVVKVSHAVKFDADKVRRELGVFANSFEQWLLQTQRLAKSDLTLLGAQKLTDTLVRRYNSIKPDDEVYDARDTKAYKAVMRLFDGEATGFDLAGYTRWGWLNAVTQYVDHDRTSNVDRRLNSAWFGSGEKLKNLAYELATV